MAYCTKDELEKLIGASDLLKLLDDNNDGEPDDGLFDSLAQEASDTVDGYLGARYPVPFASPSKMVRRASRVFVAECLYQRRGVIRDANPFAKEADSLRKRLEAIADKHADLDISIDDQDREPVSDQEPSRLAQRSGAMLF
jgi:phage gp36-like protein